MKNNKRGSYPLFVKIVAAAFVAIMVLGIVIGAIAYAAESNTEKDIMPSDAPQNTAKSVLLYSTDTNQVLYQKNSDGKVYPASITKILTLTILLEKIKDFNEKFAYNENLDHSDLVEGSTTANLVDGESLTMDELCKAIFISSANEACNMAARYVAGSRENFVKMMNDKAKELGCENTHFVNTHGLHDENHYTTAKDMRKIVDYAMQNQKFMEYASMTEFSLADKPDGTKRKFYTTNNLLMKNRGEKTYYKNAKGIKTGHTTPAGNCVVSYSNDGNMGFVAMIFGEGWDGETKKSFTSAKALFEWAYSTFKLDELGKINAPYCEVKVKDGKGNDHVALITTDKNYALVSKSSKENAIETTIEATKEVVAPVIKGQKLGTLKFLQNGKVIKEVPLVASTTIERSGFLHFISTTWEFISNPIVLIVLGVIIVFVIVYIIILVRKNKRKYMKINRSIRF